MENNRILQKLDGLEARFEEVSTLITDPNVIADQKRFVKLTKEYKDLGDIMDARKRYVACLNSISEAKDILANESDPDMKEMARMELAENEALQPQLEEEIKIALVPKDPEDAKNVQMEIRAGTGGDEACLFAGDLFNMYKRYCESKGWQLSVTDYNEGAVGGFKEIDFAVSGADVYGTLKYESGVHRVQRVPVTESNGRMQTSAARVLEDRTSTRSSLEYVCATCGRTQTRAKARRYSLNVQRRVTSQRTKNAPCHVFIHLYMTRNIRSMSTTLQADVRALSLLATALQRYVPITSSKDVSPTIASDTPHTTCKDFSPATSSQ